MFEPSPLVTVYPPNVTVTICVMSEDQLAVLELEIPDCNPNCPASTFNLDVWQVVLKDSN